MRDWSKHIYLCLYKPFWKSVRACQTFVRLWIQAVRACWKSVRVCQIYVRACVSVYVCVCWRSMRVFAEILLVGAEYICMCAAHLCVLNICACALAGNIRQCVHVHHRLLDSDFVACVSDFVCACWFNYCLLLHGCPRSSRNFSLCRFLSGSCDVLCRKPKT